MGLALQRLLLLPSLLLGIFAITLPLLLWFPTTPATWFNRINKHPELARPAVFSVAASGDVAASEIAGANM